MFANGVSLGYTNRLGLWAGGAFHIYLYGDRLNLRDLIDALRGDNHLMDQVRAANEQRVARMPERRKIRKVDRAHGEFTHCVGSSRRKVEDAEDEMAAVDAADYPCTRDDTTSGDLLLHGLVGPKLE